MLWNTESVSIPLNFLKNICSGTKGNRMKLEWKNVEIYRLLKYPSAYNIIREVNEIILIYVDLMS